MTGTITAIVNCGSVVQVFIREDATGRNVPYAADANQWYRSGAAETFGVGDEVSAEVADWGGLLGIEYA